MRWLTVDDNNGFSSDILGNRLTKGQSAYSWDILNRTVGYNQTQYRYRADGMRVLKTSGSSSTRYRYDGQMGIEDVSGSLVTRYGLGARGVDYIEQSNGTGSSVVFPVYDAHGNNVATLSRNGLGYNVTNRRSFDAWGSVRLGAQTGDPTGRYCANLGHKQDDESGLVYMRARYYEPTSGRFVSQDPAMDGWNWFIYCMANPVSVHDPKGQSGVADAIGAYMFLDLVSAIGTYLCQRGLASAMANGAGLLEWPALGWAGGVAACFTILLWSFANTVQTVVNLGNRAAYLGGASGMGDSLLAGIDRLKCSSLMAPIAHNLEIFAWLGIVDYEGS